MNSHVSNLFIYPIKSTSAIELSSVNLTLLGFENDREWAIFDNNDKVLTAREHPSLLEICSHVEENGVTISHNGKQFGLLTENTKSLSQDLQLHSYRAFGHHVSNDLDLWFSDFLDTSCKLMKVDHTRHRPVLKKHGGKEGEGVGFSDQSPILIASKDSLNDLNSRLDETIDMARFRPNIVIQGIPPYAEDDWDIIEIGDCQFRVIHQCERCVLTTIDPFTRERNKNAEPLRTLATYRKVPTGGVAFGVRAVPLNKGVIKVDDKINVLSLTKRPVILSKV